MSTSVATASKTDMLIFYAVICSYNNLDRAYSVILSADIGDNLWPSVYQ